MFAPCSPRAYFTRARISTFLASNSSCVIAPIVSNLCSFSNRANGSSAGAAALTAVIGSQGVHAAGYSFAFVPVGINSIALVTIAMFVHRATARNHTHLPSLGPQNTEGGGSMRATCQ